MKSSSTLLMFIVLIGGLIGLFACEPSNLEKRLQSLESTRLEDSITICGLEYRIMVIEKEDSVKEKQYNQDYSFFSDDLDTLFMRTEPGKMELQKWNRRGRRTRAWVDGFIR